MSTDEAKLLAYAMQNRRNRSAKVALLADMSHIPHVDDPTFFGVLRKRLEQGVAKLDALEFELSNHRVCYVLDPPAAGKLHQALQRISKLLVDHGKLPIEIRGFDLELRSADFLDQCRILMAEMAETSGAPSLDHMTREDEDLDRFLQIEENLHSADIASLLREQPIYDFTDADKPMTVAYELSTSIDELEAIYAIPIRSNPWLFSRVTEILDARMLKHLSYNHEILDRTVCVNLHLSTLLGPAFREFARRSSFGWQDNVIVEFPFTEVMESENAFRAAQEVLRINRALAAVDDVPLEQLGRLPDMPDGVRFLKVRWSDEFADRVDELEMKTLEQLERFGKERCVLTHCDTLRHVEAGLRLGFRVLQGRGVDSSVSELRRQQFDRTVASMQIRQTMFDEPEEEEPTSFFDKLVASIFGKPEPKRKKDLEDDDVF